MAIKPPTIQNCNTQPCQLNLSFPSNPGWGASTYTSFNWPIKPNSIYFSGSCDDYAVIWVNGQVVYNRGGCQCCCDCSKPFSAQGAWAGIAGTNQLQYQCIDTCGYGSGGSCNISVS